MATNCFYCQRAIGRAAEVDHFIPWSRYPVDLGHNFVLAHKACNASKGDLLAAPSHLDRWWERAERNGTRLAAVFDSKLLLHDVAVSREVTRWAYENAARIGSKVWASRTELRSLEGEWRPWPLATPETRGERDGIRGTQD